MPSDDADAERERVKAAIEEARVLREDAQTAIDHANEVLRNTRRIFDRHRRAKLAQTKE